MKIHLSGQPGSSSGERLIGDDIKVLNASWFNLRLYGSIEVTFSNPIHFIFHEAKYVSTNTFNMQMHM